MVGEQYYLFLKSKDGKLYRVYAKGLTLKEIDERTIRYKSKKELVTVILNNTNLNLRIEDIDEVLVMRKPNSKIEEYNKEIGPLYKDDKGVLNMDKIGAEFEIKAHDKKFVLYFIKPYLKIQGLKSLANEIIYLIEADVNYMSELQSLLDKISKTYKGCRGLYLTMKYYSKKEEDKKKSRVVVDKDIPYIPTDEEIKMGELDYLMRYDRESLDIQDFDGYEDISPFDEHKYK